MLLLGIRDYTLPKIRRYQEVRLKTTILEAAGIDYNENDFDELFREKIRGMEKNGIQFYLSPESLYILEFEGRGLWGMINGIVTLGADLETIKGVKIISQEETPGLGARIEEEEYLNQYNEKKVSPQLIMVLRRRATEINEVDAISGASISCQALVDILNEHTVNFREMMER